MDARLLIVEPETTLPSDMPDRQSPQTLAALLVGLVVSAALSTDLILVVLDRTRAPVHVKVTGVRVGIEGAETAYLARVAEKAGFGEREELFDFYRDLAADYDDELPDLKMETLPPSIRAALRESAHADAALFV